LRPHTLSQFNGLTLQFPRKPARFDSRRFRAGAAGHGTRKLAAS